MRASIKHGAQPAQQWASTSSRSETGPRDSHSSTLVAGEDREGKAETTRSRALSESLGFANKAPRSTPDNQSKKVDINNAGAAGSRDDPLQVSNPLHGGKTGSVGGAAPFQKFIKDQRAGVTRAALGDTNNVLARNKGALFAAQKRDGNATFVAQIAAQSVHAAQICAMFVQINPNWLPGLWLKLFGWLPHLLFPFDLWFPATDALVAWGKLGASIYIPFLLFLWKFSLQNGERVEEDSSILSFSFPAWRYWYKIPFLVFAYAMVNIVLGHFHGMLGLLVTVGVPFLFACGYVKLNKKERVYLDHLIMSLPHCFIAALVGAACCEMGSDVDLPTAVQTAGGTAGAVFLILMLNQLRLRRRLRQHEALFSKDGASQFWASYKSVVAQLWLLILPACYLPALAPLLQNLGCSTWFVAGDSSNMQFSQDTPSLAYKITANGVFAVGVSLLLVLPYLLFIPAYLDSALYDKHAELKGVDAENYVAEAGRKMATITADGNPSMHKVLSAAHFSLLQTYLPGLWRVHIFLLLEKTLLLAAIELPCNKELSLWMAAGIFFCSTLVMAATRPQVERQQRNLDAVLRLSNLVVLAVCFAKQQKLCSDAFAGYIACSVTFIAVLYFIWVLGPITLIGSLLSATEQLRDHQQAVRLAQRSQSLRGIKASELDRHALKGLVPDQLSNLLLSGHMKDLSQEQLVSLRENPLCKKAASIVDEHLSQNGLVLDLSLKSAGQIEINALTVLFWTPASEPLDLVSSLDICGQQVSVAVSKYFVEAIKGHGVLETITFGDVHAVTMQTSMTEADFSGKKLGASGAIIVAAFLPKCQALVTVITNKFALPIQDIKTKAELDLSGKSLGVEDAIIIAALIPLNGALTSLDISSNNLAAWVGAEGWSHGYHDDYSGNQFWKHTDGRRQDNKPGKLDVTGVTALADAIKNNGALATITFGDKQAVTITTTMTEADFSGNKLIGYEARIVAAFLPKCQALAKITFSGMVESSEGPPVTVETSMTEADFSNKRLSASGAIMLAGFLPKCRALTSLNISNNNNQLCGHWKTPDFSGIHMLVAAIEEHKLLTMDAVEMAEALDVSGQSLGAKDAKTMAAFIKGNVHVVLTSLNIKDNQLCGHWKAPDFSGYQALVAAIEAHKLLGMDSVNMAEDLNVSGQNLGAEGAKTMATFIKNNGALTSLNLASNELGAEGTKHVAEAIKVNGALVKFDISNNSLYSAGAKAMAGALKGNKVMTELNMAANGMGKTSISGDANLSGVSAIADAIPTMGALTSLNISKNNLGELVPPAQLPYEWSKSAEHGGWYNGPQNAFTKTPPGSQPIGVIALAGGIKNSGALTKLDVSNNSMATKEAGKALANALVANSVLKELNVANNIDGLSGSNTETIGPAFAQELANGVRANGALAKFTISGDDSRAKPVTIETSMTKADFSNKFLGTSGATMLAAFLPKCRALTSLDISANSIGELVFVDGWSKGEGRHDEHGWTWFKHVDGREQKEEPPKEPKGAIALADGIKNNGAMVSAKILYNSIGDEQARNFAAILKQHPTLKSLCGNNGDETELDMSGKSLGSEGAILLAPEIVANGALTSIEIGNNDIPNAQAQAIYQLVHMNKLNLAIEDKTLTVLDVSGIGFGAEGAAVVAEYIKNNGAMASLNVSDNNLGAAGAKHISNAISQVFCTDGKQFEESNLLWGSKCKHCGKPKSTHNNGALTSLNLADNELGPKGAKHVAKAIKGHGALASLDLSQNNIPAKDMGPVELLCESKQIALRK